MCEYKVKPYETFYVNDEIRGSTFGYKIVDKLKQKTIKIQYVRDYLEDIDRVLSSYRIVCYWYPNDHECYWSIELHKRDSNDYFHPENYTIEIEFWNKEYNERYRFPVQFADQSKQHWEEFTSKIKTQQWIKDVYNYLDNLIVSLNERGFHFKEPWFDLFVSYKEFKEEW